MTVQYQVKFYKDDEADYRTTTLHSFDADILAEQAAEAFCSWNAEYPDELELWIRKDESDAWIHFTVSIEPSIDYRAQRVED